MLLRSLICIRGYDQGLRHLAISLAVYLLILLLWGITTSGGFAAIVAVVLLPILLATTWRRVRDANRPPLMTSTAILPWLLMLSTLLAASTGVVLYCTLILIVVLHAGLAFLPYATAKGARVQRHYVQGYSGPIDLNVAKTIARVEPTMDGSAAVTHIDVFSGAERNGVDPQVETSPLSNDNSVAELQQNLRAVLQWLLAHRVAVLCVAFLIVLFIVISSWWLSRETPSVQTKADKPVAITPKVAREIVKMPDHFSLMLEGDKLIVQWLGDTMTPGNMWDLASATGDKRCAEIQFNDGASYRPIQVNIVADGAVEANFSPLDTAAIVNDVAMRGNFKLCGYDFGLKGSQAAVQANASFSRFLK